MWKASLRIGPELYVFKDGEDEVEEDHDEDEDDEDDEELHGVDFGLGASCGFHVSHTHLRENEPIGAKLSAHHQDFI